MFGLCKVSCKKQERGEMLAKRKQPLKVVRNLRGGIAHHRVGWWHSWFTLAFAAKQHGF